VTTGNDSSALGVANTIARLNDPIPEDENASLDLPVLPQHTRGSKRISHIQRSGREAPKTGETGFHVNSDSSKESDDDIETPSRPPTVFTGEHRMKRLLRAGSENDHASPPADKVIRSDSTITIKPNSGNKRNDTAISNASQATSDSSIPRRGWNSTKNILPFPGSTIQKVSDGGTQHSDENKGEIKRTPVSDLFRSRSTPGVVSKQGNTAKTALSSRSSAGLRDLATLPMHNVPPVPPVPPLSMVNTTVRQVIEDPLTPEDQETSPSSEAFFRPQSHAGSNASVKSIRTVPSNATIKATDHSHASPLRNKISNKIDHTRGGNEPDVKPLPKSSFRITENKRVLSEERRIFHLGQTLRPSKPKTSRVLDNFRGLFGKRKGNLSGVTDEFDARGSRAPQDEENIGPKSASSVKNWKAGEENRETKLIGEKSFSNSTLKKTGPSSDVTNKRGQSIQNNRSLTVTATGSPIGPGRAILNNINRMAISGHPAEFHSLPIQQSMRHSPSNQVATADISGSGPAELEPVKDLIDELLKTASTEENPTKRKISIKVSKLPDDMISNCWILADS
jgi:hypothetical protein